MAGAIWAPRSPRFNFVKQENVDLLLTKSVTCFDQLSDLLNALLETKSSFPALQASIESFTTFIRSSTPTTDWCFYSDLLPHLVKWATDTNISRDLFLLEARSEVSNTLTPTEVRYILANAFFLNLHNLRMTFSLQKRVIGALDFTSLYKERRNIDIAVERILCQFSYFVQAINQPQKRTIQFERHSIQNAPRWREDQTLIDISLIRVHTGPMESSPARTFVDFANKEIHNTEVSSMTQEEILFSSCPECFVSLLFTEQLLVDEVMTIRGVRRYSRYSGFMDEFKFEGFNESEEVMDIILMDANNRGAQFSVPILDRDLNKAWKGFSQATQTISTGHWGCGTCGGDKTLKFLQQVCAASLTKKQLDYSTFDCEETKNNFERLLVEIHASRLTVAQVVNMMTKFNDKLEEDPTTFRDFAFQATRSKEGDWSYHHLILGGSVVLAAGFMWRLVNLTRQWTRT